MLLTAPPAAMHGTSPLHDITSVHPVPLPAVPSETLVMSPFVLRVWVLANNNAAAGPAPMSYWMKEQEVSASPVMNSPPCGRKRKTAAHLSCIERKNLPHVQPIA